MAPTRGHIAQLARNVQIGGLPWGFLKAANRSEYKQLPLSPEYAKLSAAALRTQKAAKCFASGPRVLLFGATSAVIYYNFYSRALAVLVLRVHGPPFIAPSMISDSVPLQLEEDSLSAGSTLAGAFGVALNDSMSEWGAPIKFLGLQGGGGLSWI